ncbi:MAG: hypothetical protein HY054_07245 [Proteobacteria bacterium]|nr:hypothetical protein [Pseudomonadota bacterium]
MHNLNADDLRAEARLLTLAGLILLGLGFPLTLYLVSISLGPHGLSPVLPIALGAPPIVVGYIACHFASLRMVKAKALEEARHRRKFALASVKK